ncbi:MAG TPA: pseudouridine synthase [Bacteroidota bacterium]|nr:pseudouridine synthase [Bacteroidota bacterium]
MTVHATKQYFLFHKPYGVLCQFTDDLGRKTLKDFGPFPKDVYSVGRLDLESEGLLLLTNDNEAKHRLTDPRYEHERCYLAQVEGIPSSEALERLREGILFKGKRTKSTHVRLLSDEPKMPQRIPGIRIRKTIPTSWLELKLREGRNHQVRKMTASVGHPTLRLIRIGLGAFSLGNLKCGECRSLTHQEIEKLRHSF